MKDRPIRILYIDDYPLDRALVRDALQSDVADFELVEASSRQEFDALLLAEEYDLVLSDFNILGFTGLQVMDAVQKHLPGTPVIIVTGTGSEEIAAEAIKRGAADYVIKSPSHIRRLPHIIISALEALNLRIEREEAEERIRYQARLLNEISEAIIATDNDQNVVSWNRAAEMIYGWTEQESAGRNIDELLHSQYIGSSKEEAQTILRDEDQWVGEMVQQTKSGKPITIWASVSLVRDSDGNIVGGVTINRDISERKLVEKRLMAQRRDYETIVDAMPDMILYFDPAGRILRANRTAAEVAGLPFDKLIGRTYFDIFPEHLAERFHNDNVEVYKTKKPKLGVIEEYQTAKGELRWGNADKLPYLDPSGAILGVIVIVQDITESKQAQEALMASEGRYRMVSEITSDYAYGFKVSPDGELFIEWVTGALERITGYSQVELTSMGGWEKLMLPDDTPIALSQYKALMSGEARTIEYRIQTKDGDIRWMEDRARAIWDSEESRTTYIFGAVRDITERKEAEQARARSQQLLLALSQAGQAVQRTLLPQKIYETVGEEIRKLGYQAAIGIFSSDQQYLELVYLSYSSKTIKPAEKLTGLPPEGFRFRLQPNGFFKSLIERGEAILNLDGGAVIKEALPGNEKPNAEKLADILSLRESIFAPLVLGDQIFGLLSVMGDGLSEADLPGIEIFANQASIALQNARAAEALRKSEEIYRSLFEGANDGIFMQDLDGIHLGANQKATEMLGYELDELIGLSFQQVVVPNETKVAQAVLAELRAGRKVGTYERQFLKKDGETFPGEVNVSLVYDDHGNPSYLQSIVRDITERVQAQEAIQLRTQQLESLREVGLDIAAQLEVDLLLKKIVEHAMELLGGEAGGVYLYRPNEELLEWVVSIGTSVPLGTTLECGEGLSGQVWESGEPLLVESYQRWEGKASNWPEYDRCVLGVPIRWSQEFLGVINIRAGKSGPVYTKDDTYLLMQLSTQAAIALKNAQAAGVLRKRTQELRSLTMRLAETEQAERRNLARELHDQVGQSLAVLAFNLNLVREQIAQTGSIGDLSFVDDSLSLVDEVTLNIRGVMDDLRPSVLDDYGLFSALSWYGDRFTEQTGIETSVIGKSIDPRLTGRIENALFRITQEALTNVTRHAKATQVKIILKEVHDDIELLISDDGSGFERTIPQEVGKRRGWGLVNMRERAEAIGGNISVETLANQGTTIKVVAPKR